jgi:hypothetical protein
MLVRGRMTQDEEGKKFIVDSASLFSPLTLGQDVARLRSLPVGAQGNGSFNGNGWAVRDVVVRFANPSPDRQQSLKSVFDQHPGDHPVVSVVESGSGVRRITTNYKIRIASDIIGQIETIVGQGSVSLNGSLL